MIMHNQELSVAFQTPFMKLLVHSKVDQSSSLGLEFLQEFMLTNWPADIETYYFNSNYSNPAPFSILSQPFRGLCSLHGSELG